MQKGGWRMSNKTFTDKHRELFPHLAEGKSDREIANILGVSISTVYQRIERMMDIIKCTDRTELVEYCKQEMAKED